MSIANNELSGEIPAGLFKLGEIYWEGNPDLKKEVPQPMPSPGGRRSHNVFTEQAIRERGGRYPHRMRR